MNRNLLGTIDTQIIYFFRRIALPLSRFAIFVVFFWFGILKVLGLSPATPMVLALLAKTMPFIAPNTFLVFFGLLEMLIGVLFLIPRLERGAILLLFLHMITTIMPLALMSDMTWTAPFVPTLEGQYIIKNIALIALAIEIATRLRPREL